MSTEQKAQDEQPKKGINQNLLIAIIGAAATIVAALIPVLINNANKAEPAPSFTPPPTAFIMTDTALPATTAPSATLATETITPTPSPVPPTETPTTPVGIYDVYLAQDRAGQSKTNVFSPQQTVYIFFNVNDPSHSNAVKVIWYAMDVQGFPVNTILSSDEGTIVRFPFSYEMLYSPRWKVGKYKVELYLNGSLASAQEFEIK